MQKKSVFKQDNILPSFFNEYFMKKFLIWICGNVLFIFGIAFIISANSGLSTYDAFLQPIRKLLNINPAIYGKVLLIPVGLLFCTISLIIHYIRQKKIRIDYLFGMLYVILVAFILDEVLKIKFIYNMLIKTEKSNWSFVEHPEALAMLFGGIPLFTIGIGMGTACNIMPNAYAILVEEISLSTKRSFKFVQAAFDTALIFGGLLITIINIYGTKKANWIQVTHFIGLGTFIILFIQGHFINYSLIKTRQLIDKINKKGKK